MTPRALTQLLVVAVVAVLIAYDVIAYLHGGVDATISRVVLSAAHDAPAIPFAAGVLCGHLFWSQPPPPDKGASP